MPFVPRSFDVWTLEKVRPRLGNARRQPGLHAHAFLNRTDPRGQDNDDAAEVLKETEALTFLDAPLGTRKAFGNAAAQGLAVTELNLQDPKATEEVMILYRYVFDIAKISRRRQWVTSMAISRKPKPAASETTAVDVDALIHKGGSVAGEGASAGRQKLAPVMLRLPTSMLAKVDAVGAGTRRPDSSHNLDHGSDRREA